MVDSGLTLHDEQLVLSELLRPDPLAHGPQPEQRMVICGISWERYLGFDKKLGDDRPVPRLYFLQGELEIMTTSPEHERVKKWMADLLAIYFEETGLEIVPRGQATLRLALKEAGAEPDESWCIGAEKEFPDLVLEIALTSGGINKLEINRRLRVPEVWFWRGKHLEIFGLSGTGSYELLRKSTLLPGLDLALLERCVTIKSWQEARRSFREGTARSDSGR